MWPFYAALALSDGGIFPVIVSKPAYRKHRAEIGGKSPGIDTRKEMDDSLSSVSSARSQRG